MSTAFISEEDLLFAQAQERKRERRERVATAVMAGLCSRDAVSSLTEIARAAVFAADALITELDKQP